MSCSPGASKLSDVLDILSEESNQMCASEVFNTNNERDKQVFTDAVHYCMVLLRQSNRFTSRKSDVLSLEATLMGHEMFERIIGVNVQMDVETEDEVFAYCEPIEKQPEPRNTVKQEPKADYEETAAGNEFDSRTTVKVEGEEDAEASPVASPAESPVITEKKKRSTRSRPMVVEIPRDTMQYFLRHSKSLTPQFSDGSESEDKQLPPSPASLSGSDYSTDKQDNQSRASTNGSQKFIPLEVKQKAVNLARLNPRWSLPMLRKEAGIPSLATRKQLEQWAKIVDGGGTRYDKCNRINDMTFERFLEARRKKQAVSLDMIRSWAQQMAKEVYGSKLKFQTTKHWVWNFKRCYNLRYNWNTNGYEEKKEKNAVGRLTAKNRKK